MYREIRNERLSVKVNAARIRQAASWPGHEPRVSETQGAGERGRERERERGGKGESNGEDGKTGGRGGGRSLIGRN